MQTSTKYLIAIAIALTVAHVNADDTTNPKRLRSNPIPLQSADGLDAQESAEFDSATQTLDIGFSSSAEESVSNEQAEIEIAAKNTTSAGSDSAVDPNAPIEVVQERFDSGNVKIRREMTLDLEGNYVKHGQWTMFSESGDEVASGKFVANKRQGIWKKNINWGDTPLLNALPYPEFEAPFVSEAEFTDGQLHGTWSITDNQGRVASEWTYTDGKLEGKAKWYHPDGSIREEIDYSDGMIDGTWLLVDAEGTELENSTYEQGRKLASKQDTYDNGVLRWEGMFLHETFVPDTADDWWNTRPVTYKTVGEPERHGEFTSWYESGQKKFAGTFRHEVRTGEFTWWHENTQVAVQGSFVDGERNGQWVWWHENGQRAIQGNYSNGKLDGAWSYWNADGKLERKVDYTGQTAPVALHSIPTTDIRAKRPARQVAAPVPAVVTQPPVAVGTGVRVRVARQAPMRRRANPIRN